MKLQLSAQGNENGSWCQMCLLSIWKLYMMVLALAALCAFPSELNYNGKFQREVNRVLVISYFKVYLNSTPHMFFQVVNFRDSFRVTSPIYGIELQLFNSFISAVLKLLIIMYFFSFTTYIWDIVGSVSYIIFTFD